MALGYTLKSQKYDGSNVNTITSDAFTVATDDWLVVVIAMRDPAAETFNTPTVNGATVGSWTEIDSGALLDSTSSRYVRVRISAAKVTSGGSSVTVTNTTSSACYNLMQNVAAVTGDVKAVLQSKGATGTSKPASLSFTNAMTKNAMAITAIAQIAFDVTTESIASDASWTDDAAIGGTPVGLVVSRALGSGAAPPQSVTWDGTGITSGRAQAVAGIELQPATRGSMMMAA